MTLSSRQHFIAVLFLLVLTFTAYANSLHNKLFLDDLDYIVNNIYIRDWRYLPKIFTENLIAGAAKTSDYYRPLILVAYTGAYSFWQLNPVGYHWMSLIVHSACVGLAYYFLLQLSGVWPAAWITALFFGIHPLHSGSVNSAAALGIPLGTFFLLLTCVLYYKASGTGQRFLTFVTAAAALLCKETMVVLPGSIFLMEFCFLSKKESWQSRFLQSLKRALPYLVLVGLYIWARFTILNFGGTGNLYRSENVFTQNISARFFTFMTVVLEFFKLIFWPEKIHMEKGIMMPIYTSFWHWPVIAGFILFCGLIGAVVMAMIYKIVIPAKAGMQGLAVSFEKTVDSRFRGNDKRDDGNDKQKASVVVFGILWFLFGLVPVSNVLIPISTIMEDNWLYHSVIGLFFIIAFFAFHLYFNGKKSVKIFLAALFVILAGACMGRTIRQNRVWKDPITFYEYTLKHVPQSGRFRNNLAMAYAEENRYHDAIEQYQSAIQLEDRYSETHHNLGNAYLAVGRFTEAEREFYRAIEMRPGFFHSYLALASLYDQFKRDDLTIRILQKLLQNVPERWESYYYLGHIYFLEGEKQKARDLWQRGLLIDPYNKMLQEALKK